MYNHEPEKFICPFCVIGRGEETEINKRSDVVFEDDLIVAYVSPLWRPNNPGNVIIIPRAHVENVYDIEDDLLAHIQVIGKKMALALKKAYKCDGTSFRQHNEPAGNQSIWHYHLHVFPRWENDNLYESHLEARWVTSEEREQYVDRLKKVL